MKAILEVRIASEFDSIVNTREAAIDLKRLILDSSCKHIELDFQNVEFISRSFADQLHKEKLELADMGVLIVLVNASTSIMDMFRAVANTQNATRREKPDVSVFKITDMEVLSDYLYSI